jgi:hypothetical protein
MGSSSTALPRARFFRRRIVLEELLDSNFAEPPVVCDVVYSVRRKKDALEALVELLPSAFGGLIKARSAGCKGGGTASALIATAQVSFWKRGIVRDTYQTRRRQRRRGYRLDQSAFPALHLLRCSAAARDEALTQSQLKCIVRLRGLYWGCREVLGDMAAAGAHSNIVCAQYIPDG